MIGQDSLNIYRPMLKPGSVILGAVPSRIKLPDTLLAKFVFLWTGSFNGDGNLLSDVDGDIITINGKDFVESYIKGDSLATFNIPDTQEYQDADAPDNLWYNAGVRNVTVAELVGQDYSRTLVKYSNSEPYDIYWIGILKDGEVLTADENILIHQYFLLWAFWSGVWLDAGQIKENRNF